MNCVVCQRPECDCGPLSGEGACLDCEFTSATARDLELLQLLQEHGYEAAGIPPAAKPIGGCEECGCVEWIEEGGLSMCSNCGRVK